jgi:hypothetical protein
MNSSTNPYILKIIDLNKNIDLARLDKSVLEYDLREYNHNPLETIPIHEIRNSIDLLHFRIIGLQNEILKISQFIAK